MSQTIRSRKLQNTKWTISPRPTASAEEPVWYLKVSTKRAKASFFGSWIGGHAAAFSDGEDPSTTTIKTADAKGMEGFFQ